MMWKVRLKMTALLKTKKGSHNGLPFCLFLMDVRLPIYWLMRYISKLQSRQLKDEA